MSACVQRRGFFFGQDRSGPSEFLSVRFNSVQLVVFLTKGLQEYMRTFCFRLD